MQCERSYDYTIAILFNYPFLCVYCPFTAPVHPTLCITSGVFVTVVMMKESMKRREKQAKGAQKKAQ